MILLLGGTADARMAAAVLQGRGYDVLLSVVTEHAADMVRGAAERRPAERLTERLDDSSHGSSLGSLQVRVGALDELGLEALLENAEALVDATHPFAQQISVLARRVCARRGVPYLRLERPEVELPDDVIVAPDAESAAARAVGTGGGGAILVTVGTRTLDVYVRAARAAGRRLFARVIPVEESIARCRELGLAPADIVAMQGPTEAELDAALLRHLGAGVLVTKESGEAGGLTAKLEACRAVGVTAIVVARPREQADADGERARVETVTDVEELPSRLKHVLRSDPSVAPVVEGNPGPHSLSRGLLQVYTGDGKGKTTAAVGLALRARGRGLAVAMVQFVKGGPESGELAGLRRAGVHVIRPATRSTGLLRGAKHSEDERAAAQAWQEACGLLTSGDWDLVILDELNVALHHGLLATAPVVAALAARPAHVEVVATGRKAPAELCAAADLVTEMTVRKHPYPGVAARRGIEY